ncbi:MAG: SDR family NAD(P)-dependent oxidoreductase [Solirubrobacteraceae bacterium]
MRLAREELKRPSVCRPIVQHGEPGADQRVAERSQPRWLFVATIRAFVPVLEANGGGAIVNVLSLLALASTPPMTGYSASKAAAHSLTQALRPVLATRAITIHGAYPAGIDTDMLAGIDAPKTPASEVAAALLDGLMADKEDIFPDPNAQAMSQIWWSDPKSFERAFSSAAA